MDNILLEGIEDVKKYFPKINDEMFLQLINLDPTYQGGDNLGKFGKWILTIYNKGNLLEEDFYKVTEYLTLFTQHYNQLPVKDINQFKNLPDLYNVVGQFKGKAIVQTNRQEKKQKKLEGAEKVYEDDEWTVIIPKTHEASCLYGAHTQWCTASKNDSYQFDSYTTRGPLFININKASGTKYQFHFESNSFMNVNDNRIDFEKFIMKNEKLAGFYANYIDDIIVLPKILLPYKTNIDADGLIQILKTYEDENIGYVVKYGNYLNNLKDENKKQQLYDYILNAFENYVFKDISPERREIMGDDVETIQLGKLILLSSFWSDVFKYVSNEDGKYNIINNINTTIPGMDINPVLDSAIISLRHNIHFNYISTSTPNLIKQFFINLSDSKIGKEFNFTNETGNIFKNIETIENCCEILEILSYFGEDDRLNYLNKLINGDKSEVFEKLFNINKHQSHTFRYTGGKDLSIMSNKDGEILTTSINAVDSIFLFKYIPSEIVIDVLEETFGEYSHLFSFKNYEYMSEYKRVLEIINEDKNLRKKVSIGDGFNVITNVSEDVIEYIVKIIDDVDELNTKFRQHPQFKKIMNIINDNAEKWIEDYPIIGNFFIKDEDRLRTLIDLNDDVFNKLATIPPYLLDEVIKSVVNNGDSFPEWDRSIINFLEDNIEENYIRKFISKITDCGDKIVIQDDNSSIIDIDIDDLFKANDVNEFFYNYIQGDWHDNMYYEQDDFSDLSNYYLNTESKDKVDNILKQEGKDYDWEFLAKYGNYDNLGDEWSNIQTAIRYTSETAYGDAINKLIQDELSDYFDFAESWEYNDGRSSFIVKVNPENTKYLLITILERSGNEQSWNYVYDERSISTLLEDSHDKHLDISEPSYGFDDGDTTEFPHHFQSEVNVSNLPSKEELENWEESEHSFDDDDEYYDDDDEEVYESVVKKIPISLYENDISVNNKLKTYMKLLKETISIGGEVCFKNNNWLIVKTGNVFLNLDLNRGQLYEFTIGKKLDKIKKAMYIFEDIQAVEFYKRILK